MRDNQSDNHMDGAAHQPGQAPGNQGNQGANNDPADNLDEGLELNAEDVVEVIELDEQPPNEGDLAEGMEDMDLDNFREDEEEDEGMVEGATGTSTPPREDALTVFSEHTGPVFCVALDPRDGKLAVSGGEDDRAFIWQTLNGNKLLECTGHKDSVTCVGISHDAALVATGDMSGLIKVWKVANQQEIWSFEISDLEWMDWHHGAHVLLAGTSDGDVWMWKIPSGDTKTFQSHGCTCNVGRVLPDGKRLCTGYEDGVVKVWDLKTGAVIHTFTDKIAHSSSVTSMDCHPDSNVIITGSTDFTARLLNTANGKVIGALNCETQAKGIDDDSVEAVGFCKSNPNLVATGTLNGVLTIWDAPTQKARHECKHEAGIVRLKWDPCAALVYTATLDGAVHLWDALSGRLENQWFGHSASVLDLDLTRDGKYIITGSDDKTARVFSRSKPDK